MSEDFPPFVAAKPKGGVAAEIAAAKPDFPVESTQPVKIKRKRRTSAEMAAANGSEPRKRKKSKPRAAGIPLDSLVAFAGLQANEIEQVVNVCTAINTFPKQARKRIAAAIGQLFS